MISFGHKIIRENTILSAITFGSLVIIDLVSQKQSTLTVNSKYFFIFLNLNINLNNHLRPAS